MENRNNSELNRKVACDNVNSYNSLKSQNKLTQINTFNVLSKIRDYYQNEASSENE